MYFVHLFMQHKTSVSFMYIYVYISRKITIFLILFINYIVLVCLSLCKFVFFIYIRVFHIMPVWIFCYNSVAVFHFKYQCCTLIFEWIHHTNFVRVVWNEIFLIFTVTQVEVEYFVRDILHLKKIFACLERSLFVSSFPCILLCIFLDTDL